MAFFGLLLVEIVKNIIFTRFEMRRLMAEV